jgi:hypothetical protein
VGSHVTVHQITSIDDGAYLNVVSTYGRVGVWGMCYENSVYLVQKGSQLGLFVFDNQEYADEWLEQESKDFSKITKIESIGE